MIVSNFLKDFDGIRHGFFTRRGGVSEGIYASLNCGFGSNDNPEHVRKNRLRIARKLGVEMDSLLTVRQIHGNLTVAAQTVWFPGDAPDGDAMVTASRRVALGILTADCTPILLADPKARVIGAAHAGWRGAKTGILDSIVGAMENMGAKRERICAAVGPAISQDAYEVGEDFEAAFLTGNERGKDYFVRLEAGGKPHFDLPGYCCQHLRNSGVGYVENLELCTYGNESLFFSYRRSVHRNQPDYGRQISAIVLM